MITESRTFRAVAESVVPEIRDLDAGAWREFTQIVAHAVAQRPAKLQRQLQLFLHVLNLLALAHYRSTVAGLIPTMRTEFLEQVQRSRVLLFRRGFWGLRTLILMGYYARPAARLALGYRADARGWQVRR